MFLIFSQFFSNFSHERKGKRNCWTIKLTKSPILPNFHVKFRFCKKATKSEKMSHFLAFQSCSILNNVSVISSKFIKIFVQKCQHYYSLLDQIIPLVTVMSVVSLLTEQLCGLLTKPELYMEIWQNWWFGQIYHSTIYQEGVKYKWEIIFKLCGLQYRNFTKYINIFV